MRRSRAVAPEGEESDALTLDPEFNRRRTGLNDDEIKALVRAVRSGLSWEEASARLTGDVEAGVLEGWKDEILRRAATGGAPVLPAKPSNGAPERVVPPTVARLYADREQRVEALADAQREAAEFRGAVTDADRALKLAAARSVVKRGTTKSKRDVAQARKVLQDAIAGVTDAEVRAEAAAVAVAELDDQIAAAEQAHGFETARRLRERLAAWAEHHEEQVLDGIAAILALRKARLGLGGSIDTLLLAHYGARFSPEAMARRVVVIEQRFLADAEGPEAPGDQKAAAPRKNGRGRGAEAAC